MTGILNILAGALGRVTDSFFEYVTLLLPGNGTDGANNNTFLDSGTANGGVGFTITRNGNTTQGTFSPFSQTGWGNYFPGSSSIQIASNSAFNINTYDTLECWVNFSSLGTNNLLVGRESNYWIGYNHTSIGGSANKIVFAIYNGTSWQAVSSSTTPSVGVWYHILGVKDNTTLRMYVNGVQENTATFSGSPTNTADSVFFGGKNTVESTICYISNARLITGASNTIFPYSGLTTGASFNSPTTPLTNVSGTSFLTCQSNRFKDNSNNTFTITVNGSPSVVAFSPFNPTASWSAATYGGSGYFDGSGDYLSMTSGTSLGSGDFTISAWVYLTAAPSVETTVGSSYNYYTTGNNGNFVFRVGTSNLWSSFDGQSNMTSISGSYTWQVNTWIYMAWVRSGSTVTVYRDGVSLGSTTDTKTLSNTANGYVIGSGRVNGSIASPLTGYISDLRVVVGSAITTVPTAPLTAITNTSLLLNFTNAGIYDATSKNDLETVGNAQISTTQSKWGGSSMSFDGTGDYLVSRYPTADMTTFGTGDFTIEMWIRFTNVSPTPERIFLDFRPGAGNQIAPMFYVLSNTVRYYVNGFDRITSATISSGQWYHLAVARSGTSTKMFIDGTQSGSTYTDSNNYISGASYPVIGAARDGTQGVDGYINDLRITKGYARYTANFTAPTAAFPTL